MNQQQAEYLRHLHTEEGLQREQKAFAAQGIRFRWERPHGGRHRGQLLATLRGRDAPGQSGEKSFQGARGAAAQLVSIFPTALIIGSRLSVPTGDWWMVVWLDAPEGEARKREEAHRWLDPLPEDDDPAWRCPHDGARCYPKQRLHGVAPKPCEPRDCHRLADGKQLVVPHPGYPRPGFTVRPVTIPTPKDP